MGLRPTPPLSSFPRISLFLSLSLYFSLTSSRAQLELPPACLSLTTRAAPLALGGSEMGMLSVLCPDGGKCAQTTACDEARPLASWPFFDQFDDFSSGSQQFWTPRELLRKLTPRLSGFVAEKISTFSCINETLNFDQSQTQAYFEVTILNSYSR